MNTATAGGGFERSLRARVDAGEGGEVRRDVLAELRARDRLGLGLGLGLGLWCWGLGLGVWGCAGGA